MDKCANMLPDHTHTLSARVLCVCVCVWLVFFAPLLSFTFLFYSIPLCFVCNSFALLYAPLFVHVPGQRQTWLDVHNAQFGGRGGAGG